MNKHGFTESTPTIPGRVVGGQKKNVKTNDRLLTKTSNVPVIDNGVVNAPFEAGRQLGYLKDLELYLTAQLTAVRTKIKETEEEMMNE